jgi:hypothetical protein
MSDSQDEHLERILDDVLANDVEIRNGADAVGLEIDSLREVVLRRKDEVWEACLAEHNAVARLQSVRQERDEYYRASEKWRSRRRSWGLMIVWSIFAVGLALSFGVFIGEWLGWSDVLASRITVVGYSLIGLCVILLIEGAVLWRLNARRRRFAKEDEIEDWQEQFGPAQELLELALREKGVRAMLRELINIKDPSYSHTCQVEKAAGLAELREPLYEIKTTAKERILQLLSTMPGGSVGVSGPRGAGKTTLLRYFCSPRFTRQAIGTRPDLRVLVSAPVQYDARDFVLQLFSAVCQAVLGPQESAVALRRGWQAPPERRRGLLPLPGFVVWLALVLAALLPLYGVALLLTVIFDWKMNPSIAPGVLLVVVGVTALVAVRGLIAGRLGEVGLRGFEGEFRTASALGGSAEESRLRNTARELLLGLTYQQTLAQAWTGAVKLPVGLEGGLTSTTTMTDRPWSYPELVARLGEFLKQASVSHRVLIGIDEMDKIESDELANQFLNDLKAVFGLENCFWLVSVSQSAMSAFERRGMPFRDVFDSTFDVIVEVDYLDLAASKLLLQRRAIGMSVPFLCLCHCLSGGLPRDLIRVARELLELSRAPQASKELSDLTRALLADELHRMRGAVAIAASEVGLEPWTGRFLDAVETTRAAATPEALLAASRTLVESSRDDPQDGTGEAAEARARLTRLCLELATYHYYCATLMRLFEADLTEGHLRAAEDPTGQASIDQLARARQAFAVSPRVAWSTVSAFRQASDPTYGMDVLAFIDRADRPVAPVTPTHDSHEMPATPVSPGVPT